MKNCFSYQDDLKAYSDGELSPLRRWAVRRHLTHCASCREEIQAMTQMTEDLRASEPEDTLSPTLREKMLGVPLTPTTVQTEGGTGKETEPSSSGSPIIGGWGASSRKRRLPAWTYAAAAVVAWFVFYPIFGKVHEEPRQAATTAPQAEHSIKVFKPLPQETAGVPASLDGPVPPERPSPIHMQADIPAPPPMSSPPPPKMALRMSRRAYSANAPKPVPSLDVNGSGTSLNALNADPDSLRQVHKEAGIGIQVPNPDATGDTLNDMVKETGGYVAANNLTTDTDGRKSGELIVKVPEAQFETFLAAVAKLGTVVSKNITGQDITEQTSDAHEAQSVEESDLAQAEARLKALGSHAKWEDKEDTQDQRVRLAQTRARLKMLKRMAALGTITIDLSETPKAAAAVPVTGGFTGTLQATTHAALQSLAGSAAALLALVIWLLAYSPIWVPLLLLGRYALKEYKKREAV